MFWITAISPQSRNERCFVFESFTMAQVIADKLQRHGFEVEILNQDWEAVAQYPDEPHRRLMGAWIS
jgi:hypothetical protein